jgi:hypothetical protein
VRAIGSPETGSKRLSRTLMGQTNRTSTYSPQHVGEERPLLAALRAADRCRGGDAVVGFRHKEDGLCDAECDRNLLESMVSKHPRSAFPDNRNTREAVLLLLLRAIVWPRALVGWCRVRLGMRSE